MVLAGCYLTPEDWDDGGGVCKINGQNNAFISNCAYNGKEKWKPFCNALDKSQKEV